VLAKAAFAKNTHNVAPSVGHQAVCSCVMMNVAGAGPYNHAVMGLVTHWPWRPVCPVLLTAPANKDRCVTNKVFVVQRNAREKPVGRTDVVAVVENATACVWMESVILARVAKPIKTQDAMVVCANHVSSS